MIFCGQCGLQLPPGVSRCPRCGTPVEGDTAVEELYVDDPTVASFPYGPHTPPQPDTSSQAGTLAPNNPQKLVLGGDKQSNYPSQEAPYPAVPPGNMAYPSSSSPYHYTQPPISSLRARGRVAALLIILFGLLLILGAMIIFALKQNGLISGTGGTNSTLTTLTLQEQAKALIERYYNDVNVRNYQDAYSLWKDYPQSLATFSQGYAHTRHDDITIDNITILSDGTAKVSVTLRATEDAPSGSGSQISVYRGYYIVGPYNGVLKILFGQLRQVS